MTDKDWKYECNSCNNPLTPGMVILLAQEVMVDENGNTYINPDNKILRFCTVSCAEDYNYSPEFSGIRSDVGHYNIVSEG